MKLFSIKYLLSGVLLLATGALSAAPPENFYRWDLGAGGGLSFYMGDANPQTPFNRAQPAYGAQIRYNFNSRYALSAHLYKGVVQGNTNDFDNHFPDNQQAKFEKNLWDGGLQLEFNFLDYGLPEYLDASSPISPYIFAGVGLGSYNETDGASFSTIKFNIPFGIGVKYKVLPRVNLSLAWSMHKLFADDLDTTKNNKLLENPYGLESSGIKNQDWYSFAMLSITFDMFSQQFCR